VNTVVTKVAFKPVSLLERFAGGPCLRTDISIEDYHADRSCVSVSTLKEILRSPEHCRHYLEHGRSPTDAMRMGSAYHLRVLEPQRYKREVVTAPDVDRRRREYKEFALANAHKTILSRTESDTVEQMARVTFEHPTVKEVITGAWLESTLIWQDPETGLWIKIRPDCLNASVDVGVCLDLKKTTDASKFSFGRDALKYGYDVQAATYLYVLSNVFNRDFDFAFFACEEDAPHGRALYGAPEKMLQRGRRRMREALNLFARCQRQNDWPGYQADGGYDILEWPEFAK